MSGYELRSAEAVVLVGGLDDSGPGTDAGRPPSLAPVAGRPFLTYLLDQVLRAGIPRAVLCTDARGESVRATLGDSYGELALAYSHCPQASSSGGALREARKLVTSSCALLMKDDSYCDVDLLDLWEWHHVHPAHATVVTASVNDAGCFGRVETSAGDRVVRLIEDEAAHGPAFVHTGLCLLHTALLERIPSDRPISVESELFPRWIDAGGVFAYPSQGTFIDIRTPEHLRRAESVLRSLAVPSGARDAIGEIASALEDLHGEGP